MAIEKKLFHRNMTMTVRPGASFSQTSPIWRGQPEEIAAAVAFLLSGDAGYITGTTPFVYGDAEVIKSWLSQSSGHSNHG